MTHDEHDAQDEVHYEEHVYPSEDIYYAGENEEQNNPHWVDEQFGIFDEGAYGYDNDYQGFADY